MREPLIDEALGGLAAGAPDPALRSELDSLTDSLDERAWDLQDQIDAGTAPKDAYLIAFATARAAAAVAAAHNADPAQAALETTYEAQAATGDITPVREAAQAALTLG